MAEQAIQATQLRLVLDGGVDDKGKAIYKNKNYNNIDPFASADGLYAVATAILSLQSLSTVNIERNDTFMLSN
ncbi:DUF1659 domain-containing protein [Ferdinandcohnia sp. Marseille-Q9671]